MSGIDSARADSMPIEFSTFVGRTSQLAAARSVLGSTRLLTVLGAGGVGKTRFAVRLAKNVRRLYADAVWFVDLSGVSPEGSVVDEVGRIVGSQGTSRDGHEALSQFFGSKRGLLVLDNCEQVVEQCAQLVRHLLGECPAMTVIATSREAMRIAAESTFMVEPLETTGSDRGAASPAVTLFLDRCAMYLPDPSPVDLEAIAEICRRLDGLPLAIELAASRVRMLTPAQLLDRLAQPLDLLTRGARDAPDRQQTLRTTIAWSYKLCTESEQAMWRRMSVFAGGWDLESAEWMSGPSTGAESVLDVVQSLLDKSIVAGRRVRGGIVYRLLDTVRTFGIEVSSESEVDSAKARHRDWYLKRLAALEADWYGPEQSYWLALTQREIPNIRAALEYCIAEDDGARGATLLVTAWRVVWQAHGRTDELARWCSRVMELDTLPTPDLCQAMTILGGMEVVQGDTDAGARRLSQAAELAQQLGDRFSEALVYTMRGSVGGDAEQALALYTKSLALLGGSNPMPARANFEERIANAHDRLGHPDIAKRMRDTLVARAIRAGESFETVFLLYNTGLLAARRGELDTAVKILRQALSLMQNLDHALGLAQVDEVLAYVAADSHDYRRAATLLGIARAIVGPVGAIASVFPADAAVRGDTEDVVRRMLGPRASDSAIASGKAMTMEDGIAYALGAQLPPRSDTKSRGANVDSLTPRERQVAALVGQGLTDREIADRLVISRRTAEGHVANSLAKLGLGSRSQLAVWTAHQASAPTGSHT
ncbi:ATP-binding protein [Leifsonia sp. NPDC058230]|uniref:ATP-binding protein n=1 Tax=Leifsonia sp. NPDC058230 TaxID=3346391 RepID=UPI0036DD2C51